VLGRGLRDPPHGVQGLQILVWLSHRLLLFLAFLALIQPHSAPSLHHCLSHNVGVLQAMQESSKLRRPHYVLALR
jgi:hypothetical protein